ncbi:ABC transporter ATP-binding protein [Prevotella brevis]|uniref:ABC transporter ATP-binding protein n=1 Tax=Xylanibacter brevis TaxID=83231 RepID=A0ABS9CEM3_9BACT|nr:ABC transporter ATP-binding protein [Xylanibacter brevis]MCF2562684.1 ABC transporter ATP-binding protein [Xylanibacter brevis]
MKYARWFIDNSRGIRLNILVRIMAGLLQTGLALCVVWLSKRLIDDVAMRGTMSEMAVQALLIAAAVVAGVSIRQLNQYLANKAFIKKVAELRLAIFSQLFNRRLFEANDIHSGDVTSRMAKDIDAVSETLAVQLPQVVVMTIQLVGAFLLMRWFDSRLAWALILITPLAIIIGKYISHRLKRITLSIREDESRIMARIQESVELNVVLRALQGERWMQDRVEELQDRQTANYIRRSRFMVFSRFALGCTFGLGYMLAFVWGAYGLRTGAITFGVMTSFLQLVGQIQQPILSLLGAFPSIIYSTASIDRLKEMEHGEEKQSCDGEDITTRTLLGIRMDNVTFRYAKGDREVMSNFSHDFHPGTKTAILGTTGAGKTTLFRLILNFIQPDSGEVTFYGNGFTHAADKSLRKNVVFVPQGNTLISGTIRNNLLMAKPDASDEELHTALHTSCADFVFDLPQGIDTVLSEHGGGLSEGQAQRIAIARGLLRPGAVFLLDEISSALDEDTERALFSRLFATRPSTTILLITHRKKVASLCDERLEI